MVAKGIVLGHSGPNSWNQENVPVQRADMLMRSCRKP